jgi:histidine ammonia-lyase
MLLSAQALDFSRLSLKPGRGTLAAHECIRRVVPYLKKDEYLHPLIVRLLDLVERGSVLDAAEAEIGELD